MLWFNICEYFVDIYVKATSNDVKQDQVYINVTSKNIKALNVFFFYQTSKLPVLYDHTDLEVPNPPISDVFIELCERDFRSCAGQKDVLIKVECTPVSKEPRQQFSWNETYVSIFFL